MKYENLQAVYYNMVDDSYELEFLVEGQRRYIDVNAEDHSGAEYNEHYFDNRATIENIIKENENETII